MLRAECCPVIRLVELPCTIVAAGWRRPVGLLWIDGDHSYEGVRRDIDCWLPHLLPGATIIMDDATEENSGPWRVISELLQSGTYQEMPGVGKVRVLRHIARSETDGPS